MAEYIADSLNSSYIKALYYDDKTYYLHIEFTNGFGLTYKLFPLEMFHAFVQAESIGTFYNEYVKSKFKTINLSLNQIHMAQKSDMILNARIDLTKVFKEWLFLGKKAKRTPKHGDNAGKEIEVEPKYLDITIFYNNEFNEEFKSNGMVVQAVPQDVYKKDKDAQGEILGNCTNWATRKRAPSDESAVPGAKTEGMVGDKANISGNDISDIAGDLPF